MRALLPAILAALTIACGGASGPDVVLVTFEGVRASDVFSPPAESGTPSLDALAARGVAFERAFASAPLALPSHATLLTGLDPDRHGVRDDGRFAVPPALETVAERLAAGGYDTAAFVARASLDARFGLDQGFDHYDDRVWTTGDALGVRTARSAEDVTRAAQMWLAARESDAPFFLWVHYGDGRIPKPALREGEEPSDPRDGLRHVDTGIGRLVESVSGRPAFVLAVGAFGTGRGERGEPGNGLLAYDTTLHVPLVAAGGALPAGVRSEALVRTIDVAPTLLAAAGAAPDLGAGTPLTRRLEPSAEGEVVGWFENLAPSYAFGWGRLGGVRTARWKLTAEPAPRALYDVAVDPGETRDVAAEHPDVVARLAALYDERRAAEVPASLPPVPAALRTQLVELAGGATPVVADEPPDPRRYAKMLDLVDRSRALARRGRVPQSLQALEAITTSPVLFVAAIQSLASVQREAGQAGDAVTSFARWALVSDSAEARIGLADALLAEQRADLALAALAETEEPTLRADLLRAAALDRLGRTEEALAGIERVLEVAPEDDAALAMRARARADRDGHAAEIERLRPLLDRPGAQYLTETRLVMAELLLEVGRKTEAAELLGSQQNPTAAHRAAQAEMAKERGEFQAAIRFYEQAVVLQPAERRWRRELADLYDERGRVREALAIYDAMIEVDPDDATLYVDRGALRHRMGLVEEEARDYRRALELDPSVPELHFNLALIDRAAGQDDRALERLQRAIDLRPEFPVAHLMLANIYREQDDPRAARHAELAVGAGQPGPLKSAGESLRNEGPAAHVGAPGR